MEGELRHLLSDALALDEPSKLIWAGDKVSDIRMYPFAVLISFNRIQNDLEGYCTGSLLTPSHILTSAFCARQMSVATIYSPSHTDYPNKQFGCRDNEEEGGPSLLCGRLSQRHRCSRGK
ncbi:hypothetical protein L596_017733 [Steinernema carpocapsae]|uniref:Peptidase S1 domain-containing protein n=1 Tax=Steinernema carpocapsae TaxID=34508 RepID=A0A4U5N2H8_STECR|nr:hypothetical protein L596_017733 [Steinernema carpocapsae]